MNAIVYLIVYLFMFILAASGLVFSLMLVVLMIDSMVRGHDLPTSRKITKGIAGIISEHRTAKNFYDLGCARGALALRIKRKFPALSVYGVDNNPLRIVFAKIRAFIFRQNVNFLRKNIFDLDVSGADIIYTYLCYDIMPLLEKKLQKELKQGAVVITNTSSFPNWKPVQKIIGYPGKTNPPDFETLFIYKKI